MALQLFFEFGAHLGELVFECGESSGGRNNRVLILFGLHFNDDLWLEWMGHLVRGKTYRWISQ